MKIILIGATGTIGKAVASSLSTDHDIVPVSRTSTNRTADISDPEALHALFAEVAPYQAVVCAAGEAAFGALAELSQADFDLGLSSKLMGQVNVVRHGQAHLSEKGSFTLTSGLLSQEPMPGSSAISLANAGVEAFARAAAMELPNDARINVVSPPWVSETLESMENREPSEGLPAATVARAYVDSVEGDKTGAVLDARDYA